MCLGRAYRGVRIIILGENSTGHPVVRTWHHSGLGLIPGGELVVSRSHNNNNDIFKVI